LDKSRGLAAGEQLSRGFWNFFAVAFFFDFGFAIDKIGSLHPSL
jgi:hypothetical protein